MNDITHVASLIGGEPEKLIAALKNLINDDVPVPVCVVPEAYRYAHFLLENYAVLSAELRLPPWVRKHQIDEEYCKAMLTVAQELLLVSAGGWEAIKK